MTRIVPILFAISCLAAQPVYAQTDAEQEIAELKSQLSLLADRLARLEQSAAVPAIEVETEVEIEQVAVSRAPQDAAPSWTDRVRLSGDLRYRHETINDDLFSVRHRHRIRARANVTADLAENMTVGFGLSTGERANDSGNQTLGDGFSRKFIGLDLAYFDWELLEGLSLAGGKISNPFVRPANHFLIYDGDIRPEGLAIKYNAGGPFFANASAFWAEERGDDADSMLLGLQAGYRGTLSNGIALTAGASYYDTTNTQGQQPLFSPLNGQGNQLDADGNYLYGFTEVELFGEARFDLGGEPLAVFLDYVTNTEADAYDQGFAVGASYRRASAPGDWDVSYIYQDLEANAVVAAFTDSDFAGGGTDGSGHILRAGYVFNGGWNFRMTYFINERGEAAGEKRDYRRLQADVNFRY